MAGWAPSSVSIGGMTEGLSFRMDELYPWWTESRGGAGSLNPLRSFSYVGVPTAAQGQYGSYGTPAPVEGFLYQDTNWSVRSELFAEFNVKKQEGATYYKQTLCVYLRGMGQDGSYHGAEYMYAKVDGFSFKRRQYSDETTYIETNIQTWQNLNFECPTRLISGRADIASMFLYDGGMLFSFGRITAGGVEQFGIGVWYSGVRVGDSKRGTGYQLYGLPISSFESAFGGSFEPETKDDPNEDQDDNNDDPWDGGDGDHDDHSDIITDPDEPGAGGASTGFLTLYTGSAAVMRTFAESLWDTSVITEVKKYFTDPMQWIISCLMLPVIPETSGAAAPVWGDFTWPVTFSLVSNQYKTVDCGRIGITRYWGNFMDYAPYTKITIWLPYIGYRDLDVDMVMEHILHLKYIVDVLTGDCTAILSIDAVGIEGPDIPKIVGQYYGNCGVKVPLSMVSHDALVGAAINAIVGGAATLAKNGITVGSAAASGNEADLMDTIGSAANSTVNWASNTAVNVINGMKPETTVIGAAGMSAGMMSKQTPFIIKTIPIQSLPDNFRTLHGYMTNRSGKLGDFSGYCEVEQIQLNNIPAYEEELKEILALLKGGVII